tara:strand:+ start:11227 stop:12000 length:774 start_codon:yes stop_codon:yes gene_type:complete
MKIKFIILGCGSSLGVPRIDGYFGNCNPRNKKNYRTRCCALIKSKNKNVLIDTSPDLKYQLIKNKIKNIDKVFYTHHHADQTHGINELRFFYLKNRKKINIYTNNLTKKYLLNSFGYCFKKNKGYPPILQNNSLKQNHTYKDNGITINLKSIKVEHGSIDSICYIINNKLAYASDVSKIYQKDYKKLANLKYLVIDCLQYNHHPSHYGLLDILELVKKIKPKKTILTNLNSTLDYKKIQKILPRNIIPAYDGLSLTI